MPAYNNTETYFKKTKNQIINNYLSLALSPAIAICLVYVLFVVKYDDTQFAEFRTCLEILRYIAVLTTIIMIPIIIAAAVIGLIGNSFWGAFALIIAKTRDWHQATEENLDPNLSSTSVDSSQHMLTSFTSTNDNHDFERAVTASLSGTLQLTTVTQVWDMSHYSKHFCRYIKGRQGEKTFAQRLELLTKVLNDKHDKLTDDEEKKLTQFLEPITAHYMEIPVLHNGMFYDLSTLSQLKEDPYTREPLNPLEFQSGDSLITKFEHTIAKIEKNHGTTAQDKSAFNLESINVVCMRQ